MCYLSKFETMEILVTEIDFESKIYYPSLKIHAFIKKIVQWVIVKFYKQPAKQGLKEVINFKVQVKHFA